MQGERIAVALSGGVDSAVAALLLRNEGHEMRGIHMRLEDSPASRRQESQAEQVCRALQIPFQVIDLQEEFESYVIDYFCQEYRRGRTPNPCVSCNFHIKFGFLLEAVCSQGFASLATGHYARIEWIGGTPRLFRGRDATRDQSYFLYTLTQNRLQRVLFPLGNMSKDEIGNIAEEENLPVNYRPSRDICFISHKNYRRFLAQRFDIIPGNIVNSRGQTIGQHQGISSCTIGQRHGLGISGGEPLYVLSIQPEENRVVLGRESELYGEKLLGKELKWISGDLPDRPLEVTCRIRYRGKEVDAILSPQFSHNPAGEGERAPGENIFTVAFSRPQRAIAPGQSIVFYRGEEVLGGGIIEKSIPREEREEDAADSRS
jgi:tRNA-uridine 2-sulfurtransferase